MTKQDVDLLEGSQSKGVSMDVLAIPVHPARARVASSTPEFRWAGLSRARSAPPSMFTLKKAELDLLVLDMQRKVYAKREEILKRVNMFGVDVPTTKGLGDHPTWGVKLVLAGLVAIERDLRAAGFTVDEPDPERGCPYTLVELAAKTLQY